MLSVQDLVDAPMFTVWSGMRSKCAAVPVPREAWDLFSQEGSAYLSDAVQNELERMGLEIVMSGDYPVAINRSDEFCTFELGSLKFDDIDAALCAINEGYSLVKLPDHLGCKYWRLYVLEPLPERSGDEVLQCCVGV